MANKILDIDDIISKSEKEMTMNMRKASLATGDKVEITENTVDIKLSNFQIETLSPLTKPLSIDHLDYDNDNDNSTETSFEQTIKTTKTFSYSFTEGFKYGTKSSLEVGIPGVGKAAAEVSMELNFSAQQTTTKSEEQTWTYKAPVAIPPRCKVCADLVIDQSIFDSNFSGDVLLSGSIKAESFTSQKKQTGYTIWDIASWLYMNKDQYPGIKFGDFTEESEGVSFPTTAIIPVSGVFKGVSGSNLHVKVKQIEVGETCPTL